MRRERMQVLLLAGLKWRVAYETVLAWRVVELFSLSAFDSLALVYSYFNHNAVLRNFSSID